MRWAAADEVTGAVLLPGAVIRDQVSWYDRALWISTRALMKDQHRIGVHARRELFYECVFALSDALPSMPMGERYKMADVWMRTLYSLGRTADWFKGRRSQQSRA